MAMLLRLLEDGKLVALCAAQNEHQSDDTYLDDDEDHAIREKLWADWDSEARVERDAAIQRAEAAEAERNSLYHLVGKGVDARLGILHVENQRMAEQRDQALQEVERLNKDLDYWRSDVRNERLKRYEDALREINNKPPCSEPLCHMNDAKHIARAALSDPEPQEKL